MSQFQFSTIFSERRKQMQVTQEDVAQFVGVSRAAVSKWEKGLSYPDITLLPKLAMYFDVSVDALLGYEPQLTKDRIQAIYMELAKRFANEPFDDVLQRLDQLVAEYYSCYPFLMKMAQLLLNHMPVSPNVEATASKILALCERVKRNTTELSLLQEATAIEASVHLINQQPEQVLQILGDQPAIEFSRELIIASALIQLQRMEQAKEVLQVTSFQKLLTLIGSLTETLLTEVEQPHYVDKIVQVTEQLLELFGVKHMSMQAVLMFYIKAAITYALQQRPDEAKRMLKGYFKQCLQIQFPLKISGGDYFYKLEDWIANQLSIIQQAPRDERSIKIDLLRTIDQHPLLAPLLQDEQLSMYYKNLQHYLQEE